MAPHFDPPMWEQRRICIANTLYAHNVQSVLEVGCGEGNVLSFLVSPSPNDQHPITHLTGLDISSSALNLASQALRPTLQDTRDLRTDPLHITLLLGDATAGPLGQDFDADAVVCSEVIEHVHEAQVGALTAAIFAIAPRLVIVTTPNTEFNANFAGLNYGTPEARLRDADHKFEWTRAQFEQWADAAAEAFAYNLEVRAIGLRMRGASEGFVACGGCSQMAVFVRRPEARRRSQRETGAGRPVVVARFEYPVFEGPRLSGAELAGLVREMAQMVSDCESTCFGFESLWDVLEVRQQFGRRSALAEWLDAGHGGIFAVASSASGSAAGRRYRIGSCS
ncbi:S-adenosyl-L-methionine-dependent methyltransferase [Kickxella alabastrina]|uniref:S-adenosyl-L-methionine-dependent methyltransferase n=1 Tax=Kickxella alabastrina TaxID=61397 RepID=UPI00221EFFC7|nr:S-adenosyl-L-methionine-dependent methyltransferase [Kickxella alabastrina]KAI7824901.1 S-adenosyl-L-methionine-dependent methyltransferase [Kickxella alabastrina]